jgi:tetratricopeptide (TPR) repeat protein
VEQRIARSEALSLEGDEAMSNQPKITNPSLDELFRNYLQRQAAAQGQGLGFADVSGEVVPHEAVPLQPADPQVAWKEALAVVPYLAGKAKVQWQVPPDWPTLVATQEPAVDLAFCVGNFPQMVRLLQPLLTLSGAVQPSSPAPRPLPISGLVEWTTKARTFPEILLAAGVLRLARHFDEAADLLRQAAEADAQLAALRANEEAALLWHGGQHADALAAWQSQEATAPVLFNRGMAAIFLGRFAEAQEALGQAVKALPETSAWHHLGHMYLALAQARV